MVNTTDTNKMGQLSMRTLSEEMRLAKNRSEQWEMAQSSVGTPYASNLRLKLGYYESSMIPFFPLIFISNLPIPPPQKSKFDFSPSAQPQS